MRKPKLISLEALNSSYSGFSHAYILNLISANLKIILARSTRRSKSNSSNSKIEKRVVHG